MQICYDNELFSKVKEVQTLMYWQHTRHTNVD